MSNKIDDNKDIKNDNKQIKRIGVDTINSSFGKSPKLKGPIPNPKFSVSPWNYPTYEQSLCDKDLKPVLKSSNE